MGTVLDPEINNANRRHLKSDAKRMARRSCSDRGLLRRRHDRPGTRSHERFYDRSRASRTGYAQIIVDQRSRLRLSADRRSARAGQTSGTRRAGAVPAAAQDPRDHDDPSLSHNRLPGTGSRRRSSTVPADICSFYRRGLRLPACTHLPYCVRARWIYASGFVHDIDQSGARNRVPDCRQSASSALTSLRFSISTNPDFSYLVVRSAWRHGAGCSVQPRRLRE